MLKLKSTISVAAVIISIIFLFIISILGKPYKPAKELLTKIYFIGTYKLEDDNFVQIVNNETLKSIPVNRKIIFEGHFDKNIKACEHLFFRMHYIKANILINGKNLIKKGYEHPAITKSAGNIWEEITGIEIKQSDFIHIELESDYKYNKDYSYGLFINSLCKGQLSPIIQSEVSKYFINFTVGIVFIIIGMLVLSASTYLSVAKTSPKYMFHHLAIFTICSGLWIFIDYNYISLIIKNNIFIMSMKQICLYIACIFFIKYIKAITENSSKLLTIFLDLSESLHILCCLLFIILQLLGIKDSYELLKPYLILSSINLFICTVIIIQQAFQTGKNTICILAFSLIDFAFFEILQTIIYVIKNSNKNNSHFANIGFVSFISIQIVVISISAKETILQAQKATKLEEALTQSNIKILLSQIQPHFLFNSLAAIKQLCNTVPEKAALAIDNFSTFLRGNIDALSSNAPLPFSKELNIVKCYLNLEKIRFEERLNIQYDIQETDFFIPALTVQPLVENAVRYGITKKIDGGTIYIATSRTKNNYIVTITDDGLGFDINQKRNDGRSHVGIKNVRSRIKALCNGNLEIYSSPGIGTVVSIIIPDTKKNMKK